MRNAKVLTIIPARGGSKGIPMKNIVPLAGKPLLAWTIETALRSTSCARGPIVVSTDSLKIADVARAYGAEMALRPAEISGDTAASELALLHVLERYDSDILVFLQCTLPLMASGDIDGTVQALIDHEADSAFAVAPFHGFLWQSGPSTAIAVNHDPAIRPMRQERQPVYLETGAVYAMRTAGFRKARHRFFGKVAMYVMPKERAIDIDDRGDMEIAEAMMTRRLAGVRL